MKNKNSPSVLARAIYAIQNIKKLPSQEQDSNPYFQLNIWRATNYTIQLSFLNASFLAFTTLSYFVYFSPRT